MFPSMRRALAVLALVAAAAGADNLRFVQRPPDGVTYPSRLPQFILADTEAGLPTTDVAEGDFAYTKDTDKWMKRTGAAWVEVAGGGGGAPTDAEYIVAEAHASLSAEVAPSGDDQLASSDSSTSATWKTLPNGAVSYSTAGNAFAQAGVSNLAASTSADLRGVLSDEVGTGSAMFGLDPAMADGLTCSGDQVVKRNAGDTAFECGTVAGGSGLTHPQVMSRASLGF